MRIIHRDDAESIPQGLDVIRNGGVVVYPTDTAYGLGVDAMNRDAVLRVRQIKGRPDTNPVPIVVSDVKSAQKYVDFSEEAEKLAHAFWPGALTLVLPSWNQQLSENIGGGGTIGIRVPNEKWLLHLLREIHTPLTSTSANKTGDPAQYSLHGVKESLGDTAASLIDLWIDGGTLTERPTSTVVQALGEKIEIKREGAISREEISKVLG